MFAERFSSEGRSGIDDKEMEALNKAVKTMLSGLRGTGTTYAYDSRGRMIESRERNYIFEKITTILYNAQGDKSEERTAITDNRACPGDASISIDENGSLVFEQSQAGESSSARFPSEDSKLLYSYQYDSYGNWVEQTVIHDSQPDEPLSVNQRKLTYY